MNTDSLLGDDDQLSPPTDLAESFLSNFESDQPKILSEASNLAAMCCQLGIELSEQFNGNDLSIDTLKQLQETFTTIGTTEVDDELRRVDSEIAELRLLKTQFEKLATKNESIKLSEADYESKQRICNRNEERRQKFEKILNETKNRFDLSRKFLDKEISRNTEFKQTLRELQIQYPACFENVHTDEDLDAKIAAKNLEIKQLSSLGLPEKSYSED